MFAFSCDKEENPKTILLTEKDWFFRNVIVHRYDNDPKATEADKLSEYDKLNSMLERSSINFRTNGRYDRKLYNGGTERGSWRWSNGFDAIEFPVGIGLFKTLGIVDIFVSKDQLIIYNYESSYEVDGWEETYGHNP